jgi:translation initiation factor IF-3
MNHTRGLMSTAQALRQTFLTSLRTPQLALLQSNPLRNVCPVQNGLQSRFIQHSPRLAFGEYNKWPSNEAIAGPYVQLVNEKNDLDPPVRLSQVLASFDHREWFLQQVGEGAPDKPPVCKILNKKETKVKEKARAKAAKASKVQTKKLELNWAIDAHDLKHRLGQLTNFLEKGAKVELVLTKKKGKRAATVDEIKHVMQSVMDTTKEIGGTQVKAMEGEPGKHVIITVKKEK